MRKALTFTTVAVATVLTLTSCALGQYKGDDAKKGSLAQKGNLKGVKLTVGSKEFTEQLVLCQVTALALESAGAKMDRSCGMSGSATVRQALVSGDIDLYWEYTGTAWINYLKKTTPLTDPRKQYEAVAQADERKNQVHWLEPASANNTYAIATPQEKADELGVTSISDYAKLANESPEKASFCGASEFFGRKDGWPGVQTAYGFKLPRDNTPELAAGAIYNAIDKSKPCNFGEVTSTDGRIQALKLTVLEDDKKFFPVYNPALTVRKQVFDKYPELAKIMDPVTKALDDKTLRALNAKVDIDGQDPELVAKEWLKQKGFIG